MRRLAIALGLLTCVACHNPDATSGSPSAPSLGSSSSAATRAVNPPEPADRLPSGSSPVLTGPRTLTFVSGESLLPVASARVTTDGRSYVTDGAGAVAVDRVSTMSVEAAGFLERRALARTDRFSLWPRISPSTGLDEESTARMVYNCADSTCRDGGEALGRVTQGTVTLVPSRQLSADRAALAAIDEAAHLWTAATRGDVVFALAAASATGTIVDIDVDPNDSAILSRGAAGVTRRQYSAGGVIVRARITLRSVELARRVPLSLHELGHAFGLAHSPRLGDVMWSGPELYDSQDLSVREKLAVTLMLQRSSGNRFPDTEDGVGTLRGTTSRRASIITCFEH
jgi:hypothetical protein